MTHKKIVLLGLYASLGLWSCKPTNIANPAQNNPPSPKQDLPEAAICSDSGAKMGNNSPIDAAQIAKANNDFSLKLYKHAQKANTSGSNLFLSGYSVSMAFAMLQLGSAGESNEMLSKMLGWPKNTISIHQQLGDYAQSLRKNASDSTYTINIANRIWGNAQGFCVYKSYAEDANKYYQAPVLALDFSKADDAAKTINQWVDTNTKGKITKIVGPNDVLDAKTVLANAIYFKADWKKAFKKEDTKDDNFIGKKGSQKTAFMHGTWSSDLGARYIRSNNFTAARIPYKNDHLSMLIILPNEGKNLDEVMASMDAKAFENLLDDWGQRYGNMYLSLPKWKTEYEVELASSILPQMGLTTRSIDLGYMAPKDDTYISAVLHKTYVAVDEQGTEAAAVTVISVKATSAYVKVVENVTFNANRPFAYCIVDNSTNTVLFMGNVASF